MKENNYANTNEKKVGVDRLISEKADLEEEILPQIKTEVT